MRQRVYVSGPITKGDLQTNIDRARAATVELIKAGFAPLCPHLTCFMGSNTPSAAGVEGIAHHEWIEVDLPWVAVSDAVVRLPGESKGADEEVAHAEALGIPVYPSVEALIANPPTGRGFQKYGGDPRFLQILEEMAALHAKKQADYGRDGDPFANVRASEDIGIPAWKGAWLRARDKVKRIDTYCIKGTLANEGVVDSFMDLSVYAIICRILFEEPKA